MIALPTFRGSSNGSLDWRNVGPAQWPKYKASVANTIATRTVADTTVEGGGTYAVGNKFLGGLLLPDGRVFCNPFAVLYGSIYDPTTDSFTNTPNLIPNLYNTLGSVLLKNGNIYLIPSSGGILGVVYNPTTNAVLTAPTGAATAPTATEAYCGGVVMQDGRVFCVPSGSTVARIYNPVTNILESPTITNGAFPGTATAYSGGVLLADGRVFLVPRSTTIGKIYNPVTNEITNTGNSVAVGADKYLGGVLMPNGKVFCVPLNSTVAKIYDPTTNLFEPDITGFGSGFVGGVLLPNGTIFCGTHALTGSPKIYNPSTGAITTAAGTYGIYYGWGGTVLMNDGRVFCIPFAATKSKIYGGGGGFNQNVSLSSYYNKL
jgi:hypothetical protein